MGRWMIVTAIAPRPTNQLKSRNPKLGFEDDHEIAWHPRLPEFACAANAVSLLMPHAEPYVVNSAERALDVIPLSLHTDTRAYIRQERQHHVQHRRFNDAVFAQHQGLRWLDTAMARSFGFLGRRSLKFGIAFAAGFETIAYAGARWTEPRISKLFDGADEDASRLFLWHLAEEVEHKGVAHDAWEAADGSRLRYVWAMTVAAVMLAVFSFVGTLALLWTQRKLFSPVAHWRLLVWSVTFIFEALTTMVISALPGHHPADFTDPTYLMALLDAVDRETP